MLKIENSAYNADLKTYSTEFSAEKEDFALKVRSLLPPGSLLYRVENFGENGCLLLFFADQGKQWSLSLLYFLYSSQEEDYNRIRAFLYSHLAGFSAPAKVHFYVFVQREYSPVFASPLTEENGMSGLKIIHGFSEEDVERIFAAEKEELIPVPDKKRKVSLFLILILGLFYAGQSFAAFFFPEQKIFQDWGVSIMNLYGGRWLEFAAGIFMHGGIWHFCLNVLALHWLGGFLECHLSRLGYLTLYLYSGFSGAMFSMFFHDGRSVGASGAIFGLLGGLLICVATQRHNWNRFYAWQMREMGKGLIAVVLINFLIPFVYPQIDFWGHLGGLLGGILFSTLFFTRGGRRLFALCLLILFLAALPDALSLRIADAQKIMKAEAEQQYILELLNTKLLPAADIIGRAEEIERHGGIELRLLRSRYELDWDEIFRRLKIDEHTLFFELLSHVDMGWEEIIPPGGALRYSTESWRSEFFRLENLLLEKYGFKKMNDE
jgi:membrane associated rhomboid family serine protease